MHVIFLHRLMCKAHTHLHLFKEADAQGEGETEPQGIQDVLVDAIVSNLIGRSGKPIVPQIRAPFLVVNPKELKVLMSPHLLQILDLVCVCVCVYHFTVPVNIEFAIFSPVVIVTTCHFCWAGFLKFCCTVSFALEATCHSLHSGKELHTG